MTQDDNSHPLTRALLARLEAERRPDAGPSLAGVADPVAAQLAREAAEGQQSLMQLLTELRESRADAAPAITGLAASNDDVFDCPVFRHAASTAMAADGPVQRSPAAGSPQRFTLTQATLIGGGATSLVFKADKDSVGQYLGAHITVTIGERAFDLGTVNQAGVARQRVEGEIAEASPSTVRIRKPRRPPA